MEWWICVYKTVLKLSTRLAGWTNRCLWNELSAHHMSYEHEVWAIVWPAWNMTRKRREAWTWDKHWPNGPNPLQHNNYNIESIHEKKKTNKSESSILWSIAKPIVTETSEKKAKTCNKTKQIETDQINQTHELLKKKCNTSNNLQRRNKRKWEQTNSTQQKLNRIYVSCKYVDYRNCLSNCQK